MNKTFKTLLYMLCVCSVLAVFGACKSQPEPQPEPQPVQPVEPEVNEEQEHALKLLDELAKVRAQAVAANADKAYPAEFESADAAGAEARRGYDANDFSGAQEKAQRAILQYRTLINRMQIDALKAKINKHDLSVYDAETYQKAEELDAKIKDLYNSDPDSAFKASEEALRCYESVTNAGFAAMIDDAKKKADEAKERCDSLKAANAMKDAYEKTFTRYRQAGVLVGSQKYEQAYLGYMTAAQEFDDIYEKVKIKREQASNAMERAKARQEASSQLAKDADREAPLPENAEGFSDEPVEVEPLQRPASRRTGGLPAATPQQPAASQGSAQPQQGSPVQQETGTQPAVSSPEQSAPSAEGQAPQQDTPAMQSAPEEQNEQDQTAPAAMQPANAAPAAQTADGTAPAHEAGMQPAFTAAPAEQNTADAAQKAPVETAPAQPVTGGQE